MPHSRRTGTLIVSGASVEGAGLENKLAICLGGVAAYGFSHQGKEMAQFDS